METKDNTPKGADDALRAGCEIKEASDHDEVQILRTAAEQMDSGLVGQALESLSTFSPGAFTTEELWPVLRAIRAQAANLKGFDLAILQSELQMKLKTLRVAGPAKLVESLFKEPKTETETSQSESLSIEPTVPWDAPVNGAEVLDAIESVFRKYVILPDGAAEALPLWVCHTHFIEVLHLTPRLTVRSPMKRCGKTTLMLLAQEFCEKALFCSGLSAPSLFRMMEAFRPTLIADEADTWIRDNESIRQVLNCGFLRRSAGIVRCVGDDNKAKLFNSFGPVAIALIGETPSTIHDRSVTFTMRRRMPNEQVSRLRLDRIHHETAELKQKLARFAADNLDALRDPDPDMPKGLHDRAADCWRPLLAIADLAGGDWPARARTAALKLSGESESDDQEIEAMLLSDIKDVFDVLDVERIASARLREELVKLEERPWATFGRSEKEISANKLGRLIGNYGVSSKTMKIQDDFGQPQTVRGYERDMFEDAWGRYLPKVQAHGGDESVTPLQTSIDAGLRPKPFRYREGEVTETGDDGSPWLRQGNRVTDSSRQDFSETTNPDAKRVRKSV